LKNRFEFPIHSRGKRWKRNKTEIGIEIMLTQTEEDEEEMTDSGVLWLRLDPDNEWVLSSFGLSQSELSWRHQLRSDKDVISQILGKIKSFKFSFYFIIYFILFYLYNNLNKFI